ncbi:pyridoxamine 5'-phosphate oxidase family protein [Paenibacillus hamazuiensis]|uniref:pyridoxamine 5'-phosphate oxidase family protein n=1 Tax=Paenibacillus hamazuiensis TaxID=2936508 RepID=UPI00200DF322|nr:pyridoxamine 5'-phosphate oxidase family protein [Paenibacillus hamazuiensis]
MAETVTALSEQLFSALQKEPFALLSTIDHESGAPSVNAISWLFAKDPGTVRFAIDQRSRIVTNIAQNRLVTLTFIGEGSVHAIYGNARQVAEALEGVPFKLACFDIDITAVRDAMFYGSRISVAPEYEKTYDKRAAEKLDTQVFDAMKKA